MKFAGLIKNSFVDYPNEIAAVAFTLGCNFNCWYCHNKQLIQMNNKEIELIDEKEVLDFLESRKGFLDGVVISGGEPTLHKDLKQFILKVKNLGFKVKLDTNGTNPKLLKELIDEKLINFVAMDIKQSLSKYKNLVGDNCSVENIQKSINIILNSDIDYEFRTTFSPDISVDDIVEIAKMIKGARVYAIQKYNPPKEKIIKIPHSTEDFKIAQEKANNYVKTFLRSI